MLSDIYMHKVHMQLYWKNVAFQVYFLCLNGSGTFKGESLSIITDYMTVYEDQPSKL